MVKLTADPYWQVCPGVLRHRRVSHEESPMKGLPWRVSAQMHGSLGRMAVQACGKFAYVAGSSTSVTQRHAHAAPCRSRSASPFMWDRSREDFKA
jgi:hypothetical protein